MAYIILTSERQASAAALLRAAGRAVVAAVVVLVELTGVVAPAATKQWMHSILVILRQSNTNTHRQKKWVNGIEDKATSQLQPFSLTCRTSTECWWQCGQNKHTGKSEEYGKVRSWRHED